MTNATAKVQVGDAEMGIDTILIKMAQLNKRKSVLDQMRKQLPKAREEQRSYMSRNAVPEYRYILVIYYRFMFNVGLKSDA